jgi:hypothetical protein
MHVFREKCSPEPQNHNPYLIFAPSRTWTRRGRAQVCVVLALTAPKRALDRVALTSCSSSSFFAGGLGLGLGLGLWLGLGLGLALMEVFGELRAPWGELCPGGRCWLGPCGGMAAVGNSVPCNQLHDALTLTFLAPASSCAR